MHKEVVRAAVTGVLDLADVLELIVDGLDERALAQQKLVGEVHEHTTHILAQFGDEAQALREEELLGEWLRDLALVAKELAKETADQAGHWTPIIGVARGEAEGQQLATIVDDEMELEAVEPAHRGLGASRVDPKDAMLLDARRVADDERGRVDEANPGTRAPLRVQVDRERYLEPIRITQRHETQSDHRRNAETPGSFLASCPSESADGESDSSRNAPAPPPSAVL